MKKLLIYLLLVTILLTGCAKNKSTVNNEEDKLMVYTSFYPMYFLANEIGGDYVIVKTVIPHGVDSHDYEPTVDQLRELNDAEVFIYNGVNFESWVNKLVGSIVDESITINASQYCDLIVNDGVTDPHLWLDPENMVKIGEVIKDRFIELDKENEEYYKANYKNLKERLEELDNKFFEELKEKSIDSIIVSHKAFGYMAKKYGFNQISVAGISPEQEPSPKAIANILDLVKDKDYKYIFLETLASPKTVEIIADEAGLKTLVLNPIEGLTEEEIENGKDYISIMEENLQNLKKALVN